jgi:hypothetical protein
MKMISTSTVSQIFNKSKINLGLSIISTVMLSACGGGDGSSSASTSSPTLNLNAARMSYIQGGSSQTGVISGYCQGIKQMTYAATSSGTNLNGVPALISKNTETDILVPNSSEFCQSIYSSNSDTYIYRIYYDPSTTTALTSGVNPPGDVYSNQALPPTSVTAGSTGTLFNYQNYMGTSSPVTSGALTWVVTKDTPTTLLYTTTDTSTSVATGQLVYKSMETYRINSNNTLTLIYKSLLFTNVATQGKGEQNIYEDYQQKSDVPVKTCTGTNVCVTPVDKGQRLAM